MFTFQWPWLALLLPLPLLVWKFWHRHQTVQDMPQLRLPAVARLRIAFTQTQYGQKKAVIPTELLLLSLLWAALVGTIMYPQLLNKQVEVISSGYDLMLAVDLSGSMETPDFFTPQDERINRLSAVKSVLPPFIERRIGDRIGLILFADHAYLQAPLTLDNEAVIHLLNNAVIGMAGKETAIGDAIGLAVKKLRERPEESRVLILLTDGENNAGTLHPLKAAELAKEYHIRIYTIGVGSLYQGLNEKELTQIATTTGGNYFPATDLTALTQVYAHIDDTLQKTKAESRTYLQRTPLYQYPLGVAMIILIALYFLQLRQGKF